MFAFHLLHAKADDVYYDDVSKRLSFTGAAILRVASLRVASLRVASLRVASLRVASLRVATEVLNCISSKKTNMESKLSRYTNENKQQTSTKEIYITNEIKT